MTNIPANLGLPPQVAADQRLSSSTAEAAGSGAPAPISSSRPVQDAHPTAVTQPAEPRLDANDIRQIADELQRRVGAVAPELAFSVDHSSGRSIITITDPSTKQVIRQFPSEQALQIAKGLDQFQKGLLLNSKA
ncbi:MAG: flagellar protein FlaG [Proteobacteria bacterium]|nr:flagellar protein FlaG [Pseudomonadota bacterium]